MEPSPTEPETSLASGVMFASFRKLQSLLPAGKLDLSFTTQNGQQIVTLKAELSGTGTQADTPPQQQPCPATTFHKFRKLPIGIQQTIWKLSFHEPRIFRLDSEEFFKSERPVMVPHKPPSSSQACHHSRIIYHKETECGLEFGYGTYKSFRFSPSRDIVYLDEASVSINDIFQGMHEINFFENVALDLPPNDSALQELLYTMFEGREMFPDMKNLILVMERNSLASETDVTFYDPDDGATIFFNSVRWKPKRLQKMIQTKIKEKLQKEIPVPSLTVRPPYNVLPPHFVLPSVRFVEAAPVGALPV